MNYSGFYKNFQLLIFHLHHNAAVKQGSENEGSLSLTVSFLLAPFNNQKLTSQEVQEILLAVFHFIRRSSRCL